MEPLEIALYETDQGGERQSPLTFAELRAANLRRLPQFKNRKGEPAHSEPDGSDWALSAWSNATLGELGELANIIKKVERGDLTMAEARPLIAQEIADTQTYLDLLAYRAGIDLAEALVTTFNNVSRRVGVNVFLPEPAKDNCKHEWAEQENCMAQVWYRCIKCGAKSGG